MKKAWLVTTGERRTNVLAVFTNEAAATAYRNVLIGRYLTGARLQHNGKSLAPHASGWELGLGPAIEEIFVDQPIDTLPGTWFARVNEDLQMVNCTFDITKSPGRMIEIDHSGSGAFCRAYGVTPTEAFEAAVKGMNKYLDQPARKRNASLRS